MTSWLAMDGERDKSFSRHFPKRMAYLAKRKKNNPQINVEGHEHNAGAAFEFPG